MRERSWRRYLYEGKPVSETDEMLDATTALVPPLLTALDALTYAGRHMHPPNIPAVVGAIESHEQPLQTGLEVFSAVAWPDDLQEFVEHARSSAILALKAYAGFTGAAADPDPAMLAYRAMGLATKAVEAAYPLTYMLPPVSRYFLEPSHRDDKTLLAALSQNNPEQPNVGVMHADNASQQRGGFSVYVPDSYAGEKVPLVMALHGGSGHGRQFLWSWLRAARTHNCVVISPTSQDRTWSLMDPEQDSDRLAQLVSYARENWQIDEDRILLAGMSDGGTFSYVSGLTADSPFTHLAPCAASFHPMLLEVVDDQRIRDLPVYLTHGSLDWMFPVDVARTAQDALTIAGAKVVYRELADLSHTYPVEESAAILEWLKA